jgi:hypothetical protein
MNSDNFKNKSYCELIIVSEVIDHKGITDKLRIEPYRAYSKGDTFQSKHSGTVGKRFQTLWTIKSETIISKKEDLSPHLQYFELLLERKMDVLTEFKNNPLYEIYFWIWIETDNAGIGIDLSSDELFFINSISNRVHFSIITNHEIE